MIARAKARSRLAGASLALGWRAAPGLTIGALALATLGSLASVAFTLGFRVVIDAVAHHDGGEVVFGVVLVSVLFTMSWAFGTLGASVNSLLTDRVNLDLGVRIGELVGSLPRLDELERPDDLKRIDQLRAGRRGLAGAPRQMLGVWQVLLRAGGIVVLLATVYPPILVVPAFALAPALASRRAARVAQRADDDLAERRRLRDDLFELVTSPSAARELRTYGVAEGVTARHARLSEAIRRGELAAAVRGAAWEGLGWIAFAVGFVGAIVALVLRAASGHVSPGGVVMAVTLMRRAQRQVDRGTDTAASLGASLRTAGQLRWLEEIVAAAVPSAGSSAVPEPLRRGIRLDGVSFAYPGADRAVLRDVDLDLPAGAVVAVVGANGAGKSTLVKLLLGLYAPTSGRILIDDVDAAAVDPAAWRRRSTAAFQDFQRLALAARESVGTGELTHVDDEDAVRAALARAGATEVEATLPDGLSTQLGRAFGGHEPSGGQWQRIALARGLMRETPLLGVLDEPTASVDAPTERAIFDRYASVARAGSGAGAVTVVVTHRFTTARVADLIVVLDDGRVVETGSHDRLLAAGGTYAELTELQARAYRG